jgi:hypothetical protein
MTASLTPSLALAYLHELSADIRAAIVLDAAGNRLAGPERLSAPARALLAEGRLLSALTPGGGAFGARDGRHGVVAVTGPLALPRLVLHDLTQVLAALGGDPREAVGGDVPGVHAAVEGDSSGPPAAVGEDERGDRPRVRGDEPAARAVAESEAPNGVPATASAAAAEALLSALR